MPPHLTYIESGPGSGKTTDLIARAADLLAQGTSARSILILTFNGSARDDLVASLGAVAPAHARAALPSVRTANGLASDVLRIADIAGQGSAMDELEERIVIGRVIADAVRPGDPYSAQAVRTSEGFWDDVVRFIAQLKQCRIHPDALAGLVAGLPQEEELAVLARVYSAYAGQLDRTGTIDYRGVLWLAIEALEVRPELREQLDGRFTHVLIDEAHELPPLAWQLVLQLSGSAEISAWADPDQSVYGFRGAVAEPLPLLRALAPGLTIGRRQSYSVPSHRVGPQTAAAVRRFVGENGRRFPPAPSEDRVGFAMFAHIEQEIAWVVERVLGHLEADPPTLPEQIAVITRSRRWCERVRDALHQAGVPTSGPPGGPGVERMHRFIEDALAVLAHCAFSHGKSPARSVRGYNLGLAHLLTYWGPMTGPAYGVELARALHDSLRDGVAITALDGRGASARQELLRLLGTFLEEQVQPFVSDPIVGVSHLIHLLQPGAEAGDPEALHAAMLTGGRFLRAARRARTTLRNLFGTDLDAAELGFRLEELLASDTGPGLVGGVAVLPVHDAKGHSFDHVFIPMLNEDIFPSTRRASRLLAQDTVEALRTRVGAASGLGAAFTTLPGFLERPGEAMAEEERALYVAMTRASVSLTVSCHLQRSSETALPSRFFARCLPTESLQAALATEGCPLRLQAAGLGQAEAEANCVTCVLEPCPGRCASVPVGPAIEPGARPIKLSSRPSGPPVLSGVADFALSASAIGAYMECPRKFYLGRLLRLDDSVGAPQMYGIIMHEVMGEIHRWPPHERTVENALELAERLIHAHRDAFASPAELELRKRNALEALRDYFTSEASPLRHETLGTEQRIEVVLQDGEGTGHRFVGYIDLTTDADCGPEVVDFKTSKSGPTSAGGLRKLFVQRAEDRPSRMRDFQLALYALAPLIAGSVTSVSLQFVRPPHQNGCLRLTVRVSDMPADDSVTPQELEAVGRELAQLAREIKNETAFAASPTSCRACPFTQLCEMEEDE